jgi:hypothetical protein
VTINADSSLIDEARWFFAALLFETGISDRRDINDPERYSLSLIIFESTPSKALETAKNLGQSTDDDLPFVTDWTFVDVLVYREIEPEGKLVNGSELYSCFLSQEILDEIRRQLRTL